MSFTNSLFENPRIFFSTPPVQADNTPPPSYNFITLLAVIQHFQVRIIRVTWQPNRNLLGRGGTSQINQASMNMQTSFAFKRVSLRDKLDEDKSEIFRRLINEIMVLRHPALLNHPHILDLQGICWDITESDAKITPHDLVNSEQEVWPVLIFETSHFGDLYQFARQTVGRELGLKDRLKMCLEIGGAISHMQSLSVIHGDIKPQNILVFKNDDHSFTPKVADFGFSMVHPHNDARLMLPLSWPWYAPEIDEYPNFTPEGAAKADVFSFGLLCLWFIFEKYISGVLLLPQAARTLGAVKSYDKSSTALGLLQHLKKKGNGALVEFARQLVDAANELNTEEKQLLGHLFNGCLACDPEKRHINVQHSLNYQDTPKAESTVTSPITGIQSPEKYKFKLFTTLGSFYASDYRLRTHILKQLETIVKRDPATGLSTELALCYRLGFGGIGAQNQQSLVPIPKELGHDNLEALFHSPSPYGGTLLNELSAMGHDLTNLAEPYDTYDRLRLAEKVIKEEIKVLEPIFNAPFAMPTLIFYLKFTLTCILRDLGQLEEAGRLAIVNTDSIQNFRGQDHMDTLSSMRVLATIYMEQGQFEEAQVIVAKVIEGQRRTLGEEHPEALKSSEDLAMIYVRQGRYRDAESVQVKVLEINCRTLGQEHPLSLRNLANLAMVYGSMEEEKKAIDLLSSVVKTRQRILGEDHPDTLKSLGNLAMMHVLGGRLNQAERGLSYVVRQERRILGPEHPDSLNGAETLAWLWNDLGRHAEAWQLMSSCIDIRRKIYGPRHPETREDIELLESWARSWNIARIQMSLRIPLLVRGFPVIICIIFLLVN